MVAGVNSHCIRLSSEEMQVVFGMSFFSCDSQQKFHTIKVLEIYEFVVKIRNVFT